MKTCLILLAVAFCWAQEHAEHPDSQKYPAPGPPGPDRVHLRIAIYAFEVTESKLHLKVAAPNPLVYQALVQAKKVLNHPGYRYQTGTEWLVIADGNMDRTLDYPQDFHVVPEFNRLGFTLLFDQALNHLTLKDFKVYRENQVVLHTSIGVEKDGAAILGSYRKPGQKEGILVVTFETSPHLFPFQSAEGRFTVRSLKK
ncbi:MAG: hypothetical protein H6510_15460 [Acidobacteria bacterium]|nr:hypothetical protein [Acidobacteriota bacterium]MCB9399211.1 hypothetical protein [Acidobacteriota bacterium]